MFKFEPRKLLTFGGLVMYWLSRVEIGLGLYLLPEFLIISMNFVAGFNRSDE